MDRASEHAAWRTSQSRESHISYTHTHTFHISLSPLTQYPLSSLADRDVLCTMGDEDWMVPEVPESVLELFTSQNWTMDDPSPACECSCNGNKKMLPECPVGAGGLPPPQVRGNYAIRQKSGNWLDPVSSCELFITCVSLVT